MSDLMFQGNGAGGSMQLRMGMNADDGTAASAGAAHAMQQGKLFPHY
jgi:hypothetical protein